MQDSPRFRFGFHLVTLARQWRRQLDTELAAAGLSDASWAPLMHLAEGGDDISQSELALRVGLDGSSLVRLIDLLEERGMIARRVDPNDRRARRIVLTPAGRTEVAAIRARLHEIECRMLADLDDPALTHMIDGFTRIETRIRALAAQQET